ncbi:MAG: short chain dehydrogenase [Gallionellales bacterium RIFCSPLOWO2_12_FULL_59_22]|nr:MAG: short chain dehydrogenase [Gallionellales bacterium RIFCSPLOWO2_02_FULL_59_110]OGT05290.1 MAG: short chain dehydrogenase [Gallionellales bacterium RIFCSPLOWO2_02_58_13]OGT12887.1 MAG: short chain dehydrogenase [Gallionellales bacterium RIFCSPLOWO2_12_FULL_59_22]
MNLSGKRIILTGAAGGIGYRVALLLAEKGARLALVERNAARVQEICDEIKQRGGFAAPIALDLSAADAAEQVTAAALQALGGLDVLINNAGIMDFTLFDRHDPKRIEQMIGVNVIAPMLLARAVLPHLLAQNSGRIVNIGSAFGSIGFPHFAVYCASKFAMRGFSEALGRELVDSQVGVTYVSPRAAKTSLNNELTTRMLEETKTNMDEPEYVAGQIVLAIERERKEHFIGQPESFFARLNGVFPRLVDGGLLNNTRIARKYAQSIGK